MPSCDPIIKKGYHFVSPLTTTLVLSTWMSKQPPVCEGGRFGGRQSGRKCGDVDESMSDYGRWKTHFYVREQRYEVKSD